MILVSGSSLLCEGKFSTHSPFLSKTQVICSAVVVWTRRQPDVFPQPSQQANIGSLFAQLTPRPQGHRDGFEGCPAPGVKWKVHFPTWVWFFEAKEWNAAAIAKSVCLSLSLSLTLQH